MKRRAFLFCAGLGLASAATFGVSASRAAAANSDTVIQLTVLNPVSTSTYYISIVKAGTGSGTVTSSDGNIVCGTTCFENNIPNASTTVLTATADSGSTFAGWSVGGDPAVCPGTGSCSASTTEVITAIFNLNIVPPPPANPPVSAPSPAPIASPSSPPQFIFEDFTSQSGTSSAEINWYTSVPSVSSISWGINSDGSSGSGSETAYTGVHSIELDNLAPDTEYVLTVGAADQSGQVIYYTYNFTTLPVSNSIPLNASDFTGQVSFGGNILLNWSNPFEPDFSSVIVTRGTRFYPRDPGEGYLVYQGPEEEVLDTDVVPGQEYYYSIFAVNSEGEHSSGTLLEYGLPAVSGVPATSTPIFGNTPGSAANTSSPAQNEISLAPPGSGESSTTNPLLLSNINFTQDDRLIPEINSIVSIEADLPTLVEIPAGTIPKNTEETTITVGKGTSAQESFMFQSLDDGSLQAFIPAILPTGQTPFTIHFLQLGNEVRVGGTFDAAGSPASFVPQDMSGYLFQTYISNNFICTTLPVLGMIFEVFAGLAVIALLIKMLSE